MTADVMAHAGINSSRELKTVSADQYEDVWVTMAGSCLTDSRRVEVCYLALQPWTQNGVVLLSCVNL